MILLKRDAVLALLLPASQAFAPFESSLIPRSVISVANVRFPQRNSAYDHTDGAAFVSRAVSSSAESSDNAAPPSDSLAVAPTFNGKVVFPYRVMVAGLDGHKVPAVYAVMNSSYKRGAGEGWEQCEYVGVTRDLGSSLKAHVADNGATAVAHIRALSFEYPLSSAMEEAASKWRGLAREVGGNADGAGGAWAEGVVGLEVDGPGGATIESDSFLERETAMEERREMLMQSLSFGMLDDDNDSDDEDDDMTAEMIAQSLNSKRAADATRGDGDSAIVSPFSSGSQSTGIDDHGTLLFNKENVDKILDEIRPYLISDGGNVSVQSVDEETKNIYLVLEGACGSCPSSTVTMQMGIERILKKKFPDLGEVLQIEEPTAAGPRELTEEVVQIELNRIRPAIIAMGGVVDIVSVDPIGVVKLRYRGSNKVQQGVELAVRDIPLVKHVEFVSQ